jgi:thymidylate kinase
VKRHDSFIIILEGIDGSGKQTLSNALKDHIEGNIGAFSRRATDGANLDVEEVELYNFPDYNSLTGELLKKMLNSPNPDIETVATLFALDRKLKNTGDDEFTTVKIFNRYYPSNFIYHDNIGLKKLIELERDSYIGDVVFILDIDPEESFKRRPTRRDNYENDKQQLASIRNRYLDYAKKFGWVVLDGTKSTTELVEDIVVHCFYRMNKGLVNIHHEEE